LTFFMVLWILVSISGEIFSSSTIISCSRHTLSRNLRQPRTPFMDQGTLLSKSPINISYILKVSAPNSLTISSGLMTLPLDLDIFSLLSPCIMPWEVLFLYGSGVFTTPMSYRNLCQKREYRRCRVVCSIPPLYQSTGIQ